MFEKVIVFILFEMIKKMKKKKKVRIASSGPGSAFESSRVEYDGAGYHNPNYF